MKYWITLGVVAGAAVVTWYLLIAAAIAFTAMTMAEMTIDDDEEE